MYGQLRGQIWEPPGTKDKSGTVPDVWGHLEPMVYIVAIVLIKNYYAV